MKKYHIHNRPNRELKDKTEINNILNKGKFAVISMCRDNEPYIVTLSYGFDSKKQSLYFHCSPKGLKLDFLEANSNICATVLEDGGYIENECGHNYKSVVFWGNMQTITDLDEKKYGMRILLHHLEQKDSVVKDKLQKSDDYYSKMVILRLNIEQIYGKAGR